MHSCSSGCIQSDSALPPGAWWRPPQERPRLTALEVAQGTGDAEGGLAALGKEDGQYLWPVSGGEEAA